MEDKEKLEFMASMQRISQDTSFFQAKTKLEYFKIESEFWLSIANLATIIYLGILAIIINLKIEEVLNSIILETTVFVIFLGFLAYKMWFRKKQIKKLVNEIEELCMDVTRTTTKGAQELLKKEGIELTIPEIEIKKDDKSDASKIIKSWTIKQYLLFFVIIPLMLVLIYLLPQSLKDSYFIMNVKSPSISSIFLSNYTHSDLFIHLLPNILIYLLVIFLIFNIETKKKTFIKISYLIFFILPILSSLFIIYFVPSMPPVQGFSAIASSFIGYFIYSVYSYIKNSLGIDIKRRFIWLIFMINFSLLTISMNNIYFAVASIITSAILLYQERMDVRVVLHKVLSKYTEALKTTRVNPLGNFYRMIIGLTSIIFLFQLPLLVTSEVIIGGAVINTPAHYFGYIFGLVTPLIIEKIVKI
jgi:hypothetical protein